MLKNPYSNVYGEDLKSAEEMWKKPYPKVYEEDIKIAEENDAFKGSRTQ